MLTLFQYLDKSQKGIMVYMSLNSVPYLQYRLWLSDVRPPRYTGHLVWHRLLAIYRCLLHKTRPEMRPLAIPYILASTGFPKLGILLWLDMTFWFRR